MRLAWKSWPDVKAFLRDNRLHAKTFRRKGTDYVRLEETVIWMPNGNVLCAVERIEWANGAVDYQSYANYRYYGDLHPTLNATHKSKTTALREAATASARYFNRDGSPSGEWLFKGKREAEGEIHIDLDGDVIASNGRKSWISE